MGSETYREMSESELRDTLVSLMSQAMDRMTKLAQKKLVPVDLDEVRRKWGEIVARYLAEPLPMQPPFRDPGPANLVPATGVEYYFAFDTADQRRGFLAKVKALQLTVETSKSEGRFCCTLTDEAATAVTEELESRLMQACGEFQGEYDGWSAPPGFEPAAT